MSWSYSGNPGANAKDEVRWLIGDTDANNQELSDEEVLYCIAETTTARGAAIKAIDGLIAKYSYEVDHNWYLDYSEDSSKRVEQLRSRKKELVSGGSLSPVTATTTVAAETEEVHDARFGVGMHDFPES